MNVYIYDLLSHDRTRSWAHKRPMGRRRKSETIILYQYIIMSTVCRIIERPDLIIIVYLPNKTMERRDGVTGGAGGLWVDVTYLVRVRTIIEFAKTT